MKIKKQNLNSSKIKSFTLIEIVVIIGILVILMAIAFSGFDIFRKEIVLKNNTEEIINAVRFAQSKTLASEGAGQWGVFFDVSVFPNQYTLFKGVNYSSRDNSFDEIHKISEAVEIYEINLAGGNEVVFEKLSGATSQAGTISLRLKDDLTKTQTIYIENSGLIGSTSPSVPSDSTRLKDSRHVHFNYRRFIDTTNEILTLKFDTSVTKDILISENLKDGQIYWEGEVNVGNENQKLKIHTHRLNDAILYTQFCIHRDRRYNNKILEVTLNGDSSGYLIRYSADGLNTTETSIYSSDSEWQ